MWVRVREFIRPPLNSSLVLWICYGKQEQLYMYFTLLCIHACIYQWFSFRPPPLPLWHDKLRVFLPFWACWFFNIYFTTNWMHVCVYLSIWFDGLESAQWKGTQDVDETQKYVIKGGGIRRCREFLSLDGCFDSFLSSIGCCAAEWSKFGWRSQQNR
jgi:hypothetical protein